MSWSASLAPLRHRDFAWFYTSRFVNLLGSAMASIALAFAVLDLTGSARALGIVFAGRTIPTAVFMLWGGLLADRLPRTLVIQAGNVVSGLTQGVVALLFITGTARLWEIVALSVVNGAVVALNYPAMQSVLPSLVSPDEIQPANALMSVARNGLQVIGPAIGGLLVVTIGSGWTLAFDALTWLAAAVLMVPITVPAREPGTTRPSGFAELREGWDYFRSTPWLCYPVLAFGITNAIGSGAFMVVGPSVARHTIGKPGWGFVLASLAAGWLFTGLVLLRVRLRRPLLTGVICTTLMGLPMLILGAEPHLGWLVVCSFVAGAGGEVLGIGWNVVMQENVPEAMLSRAYSYDALGSFVGIPLGQLVAGPLAILVGGRDLLVGAGIVYVMVCAAVLLVPSVRRMERVPVTVETVQSRA